MADTNRTAAALEAQLDAIRVRLVAVANERGTGIDTLNQVRDEIVRILDVPAVVAANMVRLAMAR